MIEAMFTKVFHGGILTEGLEITEQMRFTSESDAFRWQARVNHLADTAPKTHPYRVKDLVIIGRTFSWN